MASGVTCPGTPKAAFVMPEINRMKKAPWRTHCVIGQEPKHHRLRPGQPKQLRAFWRVGKLGLTIRCRSAQRQSQRTRVTTLRLSGVALLRCGCNWCFTRRTLGRLNVEHAERRRCAGE